MQQKSVGLDSSGKIVEIRPAQFLKAYFPPSFARGTCPFFTLHHARESSRAKSLLPETREQKLQERRGGLRKKKGDTKNVKTYTDVFHATRIPMHALEAYSESLAEDLEIVEAVRSLSRTLNSLGSSPSQDELHALFLGIDYYRGLLSKKTTLLALSARDKLDQCRDFLERASHEASQQQRYRMLTAACSKLPAFENRFLDYRGAELEGIRSFKEDQEYFLRLKRDEFLSARLGFCAKNISEYLAYCRADSRIAERLGSMKSELLLHQAVLNALANHEEATALEELERLGLLVKESKGECVQLGELRRAWKALSQGCISETRTRLKNSFSFVSVPLDSLISDLSRKENQRLFYSVKMPLSNARDDLTRESRPRVSNALARINKAIRFLRGNKLDFFVEELQKTPDSYTGRAIELIFCAQVSLVNGCFQDARSFCEQAANEIRKNLPKE